MTMTMTEAITSRHSVRAFTDEPVAQDVRDALQAEVDRGNAEGGLHMALVWDEPQAFDSTMAHYGKFANVRNYLVVAGPADARLGERSGYYGQRVALIAQQLGLNTCWVALTFKKRFVKKMVGAGDKLVVVVALGHGATQGVSHKVKDAAEVCAAPAGAELPDWFVAGVDAALLAPTAMNQQKFLITLEEGRGEDGGPLVSARATGGTYSDVDLGIVRRHFELGAGTENFAWSDFWK